MAVDKKITELPAFVGTPVGSDLYLVVSGGIDYNITGNQVLAFLNAYLNTGAVVTFGTGVPDNSTGKNGDLFIKTNTGQIYQRTAGVYVVKYTFVPGTDGNQLFYGTGVPNDALGSTNDTYIDTTAGVFYKKGTGVPKWTQVFSMASGPAGATGAVGADGADGVDGKTILNGTTPPSNGDGVNGDFYLNKITWTIYGPKAAGVWPDGQSLIAQAPNFKQAYNYDIGDARFVYDAVNLTLVFNLSADDKLLFPFEAVNGILQVEVRQIIDAFTVKTRRSYDATIINDGTFYTSVSLDGVTNDDVTTLQLILS